MFPCLHRLLNLASKQSSWLGNNLNWKRFLAKLGSLLRNSFHVRPVKISPRVHLRRTPKKIRFCAKFVLPNVGRPRHVGPTLNVQHSLGFIPLLFLDLLFIFGWIPSLPLWLLNLLITLSTLEFPCLNSNFKIDKQGGLQLNSLLLCLNLQTWTLPNRFFPTITWTCQKRRAMWDVPPWDSCHGGPCSSVSCVLNSFSSSFLSWLTPLWPFPNFFSMWVPIGDLFLQNLRK